MYHAAARIITWSTPAGLTVEHTPLFMGRATESAIVSLWGSHHSTVPLSYVPDVPPPPLRYIKNEKYEEKCPVLRSVVNEGRNQGAGVNDDDEYDADGVEIDDVIAEGQPDVENNAPSIHLTDRGLLFATERIGRQTRQEIFCNSCDRM